jgi:phosphohistidine phosphatase
MSDSSPILQASAIPYRRGAEGLSFCLITSISGRRWGFPKGIIDPGETVIETALKEAYEEAGLHGHVVGEPLGTYEYDKWDTTLTVTVVLMEVTQCDENWYESDVRRRRWVNAEEAWELLSRRELRELLTAAVGRLA